MTAERTPAPWRPPDPLPDPVARTAHLELRWYRREDGQALFRAIRESRDGLLPFLPWVRSSHRDLSESLAFIESRIEARTGPTLDFSMGVFRLDTGALVGGSGFHRICPETHTAEVGYWTATAHRRQGHASESTRALLTTGFRDWGFRRLKLCCAAPNVASIGVIESLGLRREAVEKAERWVAGFGWTDSLTYAVLADEWRPGAR